MRTLDRTSELELDDGTFRITERIGNRVYLQNLGTGESSSSHIADLLPRFATPPPTASRPAHELDHLTDADRTHVDMWATHIEEMVSGLHPHFDAPRAEYDPAQTTMNERVAAKIVELRAFGHKTSRSSLFEKKKAYEAGGAAALIDGRKHKQVGKLDKADAALIATIASVVARRHNKSTVTESELHRLVEIELTVRYQDDAPEMPSKATLYRYFAAMYDGKHTGKATSRRSQAGTPNRTYGTSRRMLPGQEVQVDSTTFNVQVQTKTGPQRPLLTIMLDVATRSILAFTLRLEGTKGYDHVQLLTQALVPFSRRPDQSETRALIASQRDDIRLLSAVERKRLEALHPVIVPRCIVTDNGRDYLSDTFRSACAKFNIDIIRSAIHTPTDKPFVERNFRSVDFLFSQRLPGYVGPNTEARGLHTENDNLLDLATLTELLDDWILSTWQNRPHEGLRDPYDPSMTYSPNQWFNSTADFAGEVDIPLSTHDYIDLLPSATRQIGTTGVKYRNRLYDSVELHPHRGLPSNRPHLENKWEIKVNPRDVTRLWVRSPQNEWIECRWREADVIHQPHFADIAKNLRKSVSDEAAIADAIRAGALFPEPQIQNEDQPPTTHAWDPSKHTSLSMFEVDNEFDDEE